MTNSEIRNEVYSFLHNNGFILSDTQKDTLSKILKQFPVKELLRQELYLELKNTKSVEGSVNQKTVRKSPPVSNIDNIIRPNNQINNCDNCKVNYRGNHCPFCG